MEFDFFQEKTSGESCDDDAWKVIQGTLHNYPEVSLCLLNREIGEGCVLGGVTNHIKATQKIKGKFLST